MDNQRAFSMAQALFWTCPGAWSGAIHPRGLKVVARAVSTSMSANNRQSTFDSRIVWHRHRSAYSASETTLASCSLVSKQAGRLDGQRGADGALGGTHSVSALAASTSSVGEPPRIAETTARSTSAALWGTVTWMVTEPELACRSRYLRVCSRLLSRRASIRLRISAAVRVLDLAMVKSFM